jgi:hypothetical protein
LRFFPARCAVFILLLAAATAPLCASLQAESDSLTKLLLTAQQLKRLGRERTRKTERWANFENRVNGSPDSPERGFELALYYAITHDDKAGSAAAQWALDHPGEARQVALVADWCADKFAEPQRRQLLTAAVRAQIGPGAVHSVVGLDPLHYRDLLFLQAVLGPSFPTSYETWWNSVVDPLARRDGNWLSDPEQIYALCEILEVVRENTRIDLRAEHLAAFQNLPSEYLLSLHPRQLEKPTWQMRVAALALIGIDPNLASAQYVQGWAMEDPRVIREGPGVAYEFLWADPYLPGLSFYNLDPWAYDPDAGLLYARTSWEPDSCWIRISAAVTKPQQTGAVADENCATGWREKPFEAGHLTLLPFQAGCLDVPKVPKPLAANAPVYLAWGLKPNTKVTFADAKKKTNAIQADRSGMLRIPMNGEEKICVAKAR